MKSNCSAWKASRESVDHSAPPMMWSTFSLLPSFLSSICLADRISLGVDLLAVKHALDSLSALRADRPERLFRHSQHAPRAAGTVVQQIGAGFDLVLNGQEHEVRH